MEQHPIPQSITTYKFKLVGNMTLKQFLELAAGIIGAWLVFNSGAAFLIKWTLGPMLGFIGFALAFLPLEDRPLDQWLINFIKAIYAPTQFIYRPQAKKLEIFEATKKAAGPSGPAFAKGSGGQSQLSDYLESLPQTSTSAFDQAESKYLEHITNLFAALGNKVLPLTTKTEPTPQSLARSGVRGVRVRQLSHPQMCLLPRAVVFSAPEEVKQAAMPATQKPGPVKAAAPPSPKAPAGKAKPQPKQTTITPAPLRPSGAGASAQAPTFATDLIMPQKPDKPNIISGITLDKDGKIVANVILEIRDNQGFPVRALKSNKLGQFFIATPLPDGIYEIHAEHEGYKFAIIRLEAKNEIIPPLKIQAAA